MGLITYFMNQFVDGERTLTQSITGVIKFRINQDFQMEHSCILHIRSNIIAVICYQNLS